MYRSHTCGELGIKNAGNTVTLAGWVQTVRKFGAITFVDLRDRYGITQLLFGEELNQELDKNPIGREFVLQAIGKVQERSNKNPNLPTGGIEISVTSFKMFRPSGRMGGIRFGSTIRPTRCSSVSANPAGSSSKATGAPAASARTTAWPGRSRCST